MASIKKTVKVRYDKNHVRLNKGEYQRADGRYCYRWTDLCKNRRAIYARTLDELRRLEKQIQRDRDDGIREDMSYATVNQIFELWKETKRGLRDRTKTSYIYFYDLFVRPNFGQKRIQSVKRSDVRAFYNNLIETRGIKVATLDNIHTVLHQVFQLAVDDDIIRKNPSSMMLKEIKRAFGNDSVPRKALTLDEEDLFFSEVMKRPRFRKWYPILYIMANTGMRIGEISALRWCDVDLIKDTISINHTLVYYNHRDENGCSYTIHKPKTEAGNRTIPITPSVKEAFLMQKEYLELAGLKSVDHIDGYDDFIFVNRFGHVMNQSTVNTAIQRMTRDINLDILDQAPEGSEPLVVPYFSCHILRHTYATKLCEFGVGVRTIQELLGQVDLNTTMRIYIDVTEDLKKREVEKYEQAMKAERQHLEIVGPDDI
ncbi:MAG: site-specific integrase [Lachnospiraceae bacterium]|nr:site-specific integrase [Lachnospiraceae bacterium]